MLSLELTVVNFLIIFCLLVLLLTRTFIVFEVLFWRKVQQGWFRIFVPARRLVVRLLLLLLLLVIVDHIFYHGRIRLLFLDGVRVGEIRFFFGHRFIHNVIGNLLLRGSFFRATSGLLFAVRRSLGRGFLLRLFSLWGRRFLLGFGRFYFLLLFFLWRYIIGLRGG